MRAPIPLLAVALVVPASASATLDVVQGPPAGSWLTEERWELREDLRLGSLDGGGADQFGDIGSIVVGDGGRIYVLETLAQEVRVFDSDGTFAFSVGGMGAGPGEFQGAAQLALSPNQGVWVSDPISNRYTGFSRDGELLATFPRRILGHSAAGAFLSDGSYIDWAASFPDEGPDVVAGSRVVLHPIRLSAGFEPTDTLSPITFRQEMISELGIPQVFFKARPQVYVERNGSIWVSGTEGYQVSLRTPTGTATPKLELRREPAFVSRADRELIAERYRGRPELLAAYLDALPATKPMIHGLVGDGEGHVYVVPEDSDAAAGTALDVFRDSGEYLGRLDLPLPIGRPGLGRLDPIYVTEDHVYHVIRDDFDVPYVTRSVIIRP